MIAHVHITYILHKYYVYVIQKTIIHLYTPNLLIRVTQPTVHMHAGYINTQMKNDTQNQYKGILRVYGTLYSIGYRLH